MIPIPKCTVVRGVAADVFSFFYKCLISLYKFSEVSLFRITQWSDVSGNPPLFEIIVAHPLDEASNAVLPNGSSHLEGTTAISVLDNTFKTL